MPTSQAQAGTVPPGMAQSRYGRPRRRRIPEGWLIAGFATLALAVFLVWAFTAGGIGTRASALSPTVTGTSISADGMRITVHYTVDASPGTRYACAVEAQDKSHAIVGWKVVDHAAGDTSQRSYTQTIRSVQPAVAGLIYDCWVG